MATKTGLARTKPELFGVPSVETATRIDDSDAANAACAAQYRYSARMRELEAQFEGKASEVRAAFLAELAEIRGDEAAYAATKPHSPGVILHGCP
jgi:hypothetical protein